MRSAVILARMVRGGGRAMERGGIHSRFGELSDEADWFERVHSNLVVLR